jgi:hypothetical protein
LIWIDATVGIQRWDLSRKIIGISWSRIVCWGDVLQKHCNRTSRSRGDTVSIHSMPVSVSKMLIEYLPQTGGLADNMRSQFGWFWMISMSFVNGQNKSLKTSTGFTIHFECRTNEPNISVMSVKVC